MNIIKSMNKQGGKRFYVAYRGDEWIAKIFYHSHLNNYLIDFEENVSDEEKSFIYKYRDKLNADLKLESKFCTMNRGD